LLATGACFATREDVRLLQNEMEAMRADAARTDSTRQRQFTEVIATLGQVHDSLGLMSGRLMKMQGDIRSDLYSMGQQLIQVQELTGQSQRRLQELRASLEARGQEIQEQAAPPVAQPAAPNRGTSGAAATTAAPGTPGPNQLFQLALDQLRRGSAGAARTALQTLLQQYPTADIAPEAQFYLGEAYRAEGNGAAADSAYAVVVEKYPDSPRAPTAMYKRALYMEQQGNMTAARATLNDLVKKYPRSDEAALARDHLRSMK
jgi:tol-pal system protein YbgF